VTSGLPAIDAAAVPRVALLLADPFTSAPRLLIDHFANEAPKLPIHGGMASGGRAIGENRLFLNGSAMNEGAVGVLLSGSVRVRSIVSQGCRPVGTHYIVTAADGNVIHSLGGLPAM